MKIVITGGAGYLGSILAPMLLEQGHTVYVLDSLIYGGESLLGIWTHPRFRFLKGDVRQARDLLSAASGIQAVIHLAAIVGDPACARQPDLARSVNLQASLDLLRYCTDQKVERFIFASTCSNYGKMPDPESYVNELSPLAPVSLYAETKVAFEKALLANSAPLTTTALRLSTLYGVSPRMRFDLTVNEFTRDLFVRKELQVFGEQFWRPYVHVRDAARAIMLVLDAPPGKVRNQVFNVGDKTQNYQKRQLIEFLQLRIPDTHVEYVQKKEDPRDYRVAFDKIQSQLDFRITRTVPDGMDEILTLLRAGAIKNLSADFYHN